MSVEVCNSISKCEKLSQWQNAENHEAQLYFGYKAMMRGSRPKMEIRRSPLWSGLRQSVVVATTKFGMTCNCFIFSGSRAGQSTEFALVGRPQKGGLGTYFGRDYNWRN